MDGAAIDEGASTLRRSSEWTCSYCRSAIIDAVEGFGIDEASRAGADPSSHAVCRASWW
jgi:hypothetical protein